MDVLCIIPARGNSSRVPGKNKMVVGGKPCVGHAVTDALGSSYSPHVVVLSDDDETLEIGKLYGAEALVEPPELAADDNMYHGLKYALELCEHRYGPYNAMVMLYGNVVNRPPAIVDKVLDKLFASDVDSVGTVRRVPTHYHPFCQIMLDIDGRSYRWWPMTRAMKLLNSQDQPEVYCDAAATHSCKRASFDAVWRDRSGTSSCVICETLTVEIDTLEDAAWAEFLMSRQVRLSDQRESYGGMG